MLWQIIGMEMTREQFSRWLAGRVAAGETQVELAQQLGVSRQAIGQWLEGSGVSRPVLLLASRICAEEENEE